MLLHARDIPQTSRLLQMSMQHATMHEIRENLHACGFTTVKIIRGRLISDTEGVGMRRDGRCPHPFLPACACTHGRVWQMAEIVAYINHSYVQQNPNQLAFM